MKRLIYTLLAAAAFPLAGAGAQKTPKCGPMSSPIRCGWATASSM